MASLIAENQHLVPVYFKKNYAKQGKVLVIISDLEDVKDDIDQDPIT